VLIADFMGSTAKFRDFIWEFLPDPPENRPRVAYRLSWDKKDMKKTMNKVYNYRSRALHNGIPFPDPMCSWPEPIGIAGYLSEVPSKLAMRCRGGTWRKEDIPLLLHTFEYIVRNALLNWWSKMVTDSR
jgi:hypothetical protein